MVRNLYRPWSSSGVRASEWGGLSIESSAQGQRATVLRGEGEEPCRQPLGYGQGTPEDLLLAPGRLHGRPGTSGGVMRRCQRCDIPLGFRPCLNPLCPEQHGQSAGALCIWCSQNHEERREGIDIPS